MKLNIKVNEVVLNGITTTSLEALEPMLLTLGKTPEMLLSITETITLEGEEGEYEKTNSITKELMTENGVYDVRFYLPPPPLPVIVRKEVGEQAEISLMHTEDMTINSAIDLALFELGFSLDLSQVTVVVDTNNQTIQFPESTRNELVKAGSVISLLAIGKPTRG